MTQTIPGLQNRSSNRSARSRAHHGTAWHSRTLCAVLCVCTQLIPRAQEHVHERLVILDSAYVITERNLEVSDDSRAEINRNPFAPPAAIIAILLLSVCVRFLHSTVQLHYDVTQESFLNASL